MRRRGPGRPPLAEGEETRVLYVRIPASEHAAIVQAAAMRGLKVAEYVRRALARAARRDAGAGPGRPEKIASDY